MPERMEAEKGMRLSELAAAIEARGLVGAGRLAAALFERGSAEDLAPYGLEDLVGIAEGAWQRLQTRRLGRPAIAVFNPEPASSALAAVTVIEILNDNMPFLVDSVMGELTESGHGIRLVLHPILTVRRDAAGALHELKEAGPAFEGDSRESLIHIHVDRIASDNARAALAERLRETLDDVRRAVTDWRAMLARVDAVIADWRAEPPPLPVEETAEALQFLQWLRDDNFTFLGMRDYVHRAEEGGASVERIEQSGLGILSDPSLRVLRRGDEAVNSSSEMRDYLRSTVALVVTKANLRSRVHRRVHMDAISIKLYGRDGALSGELRIVGLFTSTAYTRSTRTIPYVRRKVDRTLARAGFDPTGHSGKVLINVMESYPRDELFQIDDRTLYDFALQIMALDEHPRVRVLARRDTFDRFVSVLVYVPRERYSTDVRIRIGEYLEKAFAGRVVHWQPSFPEGALARVHIIVGRYSGPTPAVSQETLEAAVAAIVRTWGDALREALNGVHAAAEADRLCACYGRAFGAAYREAFEPAAAVRDIRILERLNGERRVAIDFGPREGAGPAAIGLKLYSLEQPVPLSDRVPVLENMGLRVIDERTYRIEPAEAPGIYLHDMTLERADGAPVGIGADGDGRIEALFMAVWYGVVENDGFNALGLAAGLGFREIALLRALARYLRQVRMPYSLDYVWSALGREPAVAAALVRLFEARLGPDHDEAREAALKAEIEARLEAVTSLDDDTILRRLLNLVSATVRTNYWQLDRAGQPRDTVAFKIDSRAVTDLPEPKPFREIWVYGPRVEGVHMRFGKVARGGLRWSDRPQDFRTEVLGLVKAQQVKNAVIVPVGAKGGFVPKRLKPGMARDAWLQEGTEAYCIFVSSLLSVTDNLAPDGAIVPPEAVTRRDGDDPYLVVAADKGTATFSDTANGLALDAGFWLGDAFASGGSAGYDHKKMGITARGAFEAVKRHFREMDVDIATTPVTVAGVGDMSGDVFGNGMLLARTIRLVAAFDHRDIFIDPDPDPEASFAERRRLFALPRSSWADYDRARLSPGGGVFPRSAKAIELSAEARALLGLTEARPTPQAVMRAILKLPVDLLWFGGIGTYIRAADETDAEVGDKANDPIRVAGREVRAKVIGEGANLGMTQRGRIEYALAGGRCNSDAIDNSAGVNSSDVEVNIKIALGPAVRSGRLPLAERNALLASMTDEVAGLVLRNNYMQTLSISLTARRGMEDFGFQRRLIQSLERDGLLNRAVEFLPDDAELARREKAGQALTRSEIGVLLAYAKLSLKEALIESDVPDDPHLGAELVDYFPSGMRAGQAEGIAGHRLKREIVATRLVNAMIDRGGATLVTRIADQTGADPAAIARAFAVARAVFDLDALNGAVDGLDGRLAGAAQLGLYGLLQDLLLGAMVWFLRNVDLAAGLAPVIERFRAGVAELGPGLGELLPAGLGEPAAARAAGFEEAGVPADLARRLAFLPAAAAVPDIVLVAERSEAGLARAAAAYFGLAERFRLGRLAEQSRQIPVGDYYDTLALDRARALLADAHRRLAAAAMVAGGGLDGWLAQHGPEVERTLAVVGGITGEGMPSVSRFAVAAGLIADLAKE